jgi:Carbohydrate binding module (family 6)/Secretion system C-terminal sorting domain
MKKLLLFFFLPVICYGQGDQTIINVPINATGGTFQAILHLPNDYGTASTAYPLLVFLHGLGEGGPSPASIYTSSTAGGPAYFIAQGVFPTSFVNPKDGNSYKYIVVSPQANPEGVEGSTTAQELDYVLTYLYSHYRVDTSRVYLTGLSDGGESVLEYLGAEMVNGGNFEFFHPTHHVAAIVPMSENGSALLFQQEADSIVDQGVGSWGFGSTDEQGANTLQLANYCNALKAGSMITTSYAGGHCCWGQFYDPTFTQNGMSIYQWMLQFTRAPNVPLVTTPTANAGTAQTLQLPISQIRLIGTESTDQNGTIAKYSWTQQSGPSKAVIDSASAASTTVTGLSAGVYVFALTITDNTGKTSTATVQVTVDVSLPAVVGLSLPGKIEAANFNSSHSVGTQTTTDAGGGQNVDDIGLGSWMDYTVNVTAAGTYTFNFRLSTLDSGARFQVRTATGAVLATIQVPVTGGWQNWVTFAATITLPAGSQTLQLYSSAAAPWNINWIEVTSGGLPTKAVPGQISAASYSSMNSVATQTTSDAGGGLNVGWMVLGSWMDYAVNVATAGTYTVNFRLATIENGGVFQVRNASGTVLTTVQVPNTGGWGSWTTVSAKVSLPSGNQTLQLYSSAGATWNINWMQFALSSMSTQTAIQSITGLASDSALIASNTTDSVTDALILYPNPATTTFAVQVNNSLTGTMIIQVIDAAGTVHQVQVLQKDQLYALINMSAANLSAGIYFIRVQIGAWSEIKKLIKY